MEKVSLGTLCWGKSELCCPFEIKASNVLIISPSVWRATRREFNENSQGQSAPSITPGFFSEPDIGTYFYLH